MGMKERYTAGIVSAHMHLLVNCRCAIRNRSSGALLSWKSKLLHNWYIRQSNNAAIVLCFSESNHLVTFSRPAPLSMTIQGSALILNVYAAIQWKLNLNNYPTMLVGDGILVINQIWMIGAVLFRFFLVENRKKSPQLLCWNCCCTKITVWLLIS